MGQALYRTWRPQTFDDVIGQEHVVRTLRNALRTGHIHHAYLLAGPRGTGKTTTARLIAKAVNCLSPPEKRPCGTCEMCRAISDGRLMDLVEIDGASTNGVDNVRDLLEKVGFRPAQARYKVYIIDEVHMLSTAAFNALLKTLEEPPEHVIFILATTEVYKIPETILSRCQRYEFRRIPLDAIIGQLQTIAESENITVELEALSLIARAATGSMRDAISLFDQMSAGGEVSADTVRLTLGAERRDVIRALLEAWLDKELSRGLALINSAVDCGADPRQFARQTTDFLRGLLLIRLGAGHTWTDPTDDERPVFENLARKASIEELVKAVEYFSAVAEKRRTGWQPQLALELAFIQASQPAGPAVPSTAVSPAIPTVVRETRGSSAENLKPQRETTHPRNVPSKPGNDPPAVKNAAPVNPAKARTDRAVKPDMAQNDAAIAAQIGESWNEILQIMRPVSLGALLRDAAVAGIDEQNYLILSFQHTFHCEKVNELSNRRAIEDVLAERFNHKISVRCLMQDEWLAPKQDEPAGNMTQTQPEPSTGPAVIQEDSLIRRAQEELGAVAKVDGV